MGLRIVVCVKSTPKSTNVSVDAATGQPKIAGALLELNPYDEFAVEESVRLKEKFPDCTITALTIGADDALREAVARGVDDGMQISGAEFEGGDGYATSLALSAAIKKLHADKPVSLVLFGKNTSDVGAGVCGAQTAAWLDWPSATAVMKIDAIDEKSATVSRSMEDGTDQVKLTLPACVSTVKELNTPRLPSLKGKMAAKKATFPKWGAAELGLAPAQVGAAGAATAVVKAATPAPRAAGVKVEGATSAEKAHKLVDILIERKLL